MNDTLMNSTTCVIDGFGPLPLVRPNSVADLGDLVRAAAASKSALYPVGGQTKTALGMPPTRPGRTIDLRGLAQVIDFPARDMTITVQAGITMQALRDILEKEKLRLPIDVPEADRATLGGVLATNTSGPRRYGYGTMRDYVIGISALNDEGNEFKAGGRVVKNVAGYDLCKLLVGSLGTLGIITQVTLKLRPLAEQQAVFGLGCESAQLETLLRCLHESRTRPVCLEVLNQAAARIAYTHANLAIPESPWTVLVGYEGNGDAVSWQVQQLVKEVGTDCSLEARVDFPAMPLCHALCEFAAAPHHAVTFKANLLPSEVAAFCVAADQGPLRPAVRAHAGSGIVYGNWSADLTKEQAGSILTTWRERARQGAVIVQRCPSDWKAGLNVWGPAPHDVALMHAIKAKFDPNRIFNPGRFVDGI
ncbi:MAG: FAD-binding oxidoreductase [Gemmataceae bacterium]|nr:FAD-binding oxidoreductase [Gemmataceae bacterium]